MSPSILSRGCWYFIVLFVLFYLVPIRSKAAETTALKKASVEELSGEVTIRKENATQAEKAVVKTIVQGKDIIQTGKKSRAELEFEDQSICRLGSNTIFSFNPDTRDMAFTRGVALVHVPPGKGGAHIATPAATAAISGDTLVVRATVMPDGTPATQFTAMSPRGGPTDGNIVVTLTSNPSQSFTLEAGHVAIVPQNATSLAQVPRAEIDVATFAAHSPLMQDLPPTASQELKMVSMDQANAFASGAAQKTEYAIVGDHVVKADANGEFHAPAPTEPAPGTQTSPDGAPAAGTPPPGGSTTSTMSTDGGTAGPAPSGGFSLMGTEFAAAPNTFNFFQDFTGTLAEINNQPPPPGPPPPIGFTGVGLASITSNLTLDLSSGAIISGSISGPFGFFGGGKFAFDQLSIGSGTITLQNGNFFQMEAVGNTPTGTMISLTGAATFTFSSGPGTVVLRADNGDIAFASGSITSAGNDVKIFADKSGSTINAGTITTSGAGAKGGSVTVSTPTGGNITLGGSGITANGGTAQNAGDVTVNSGSGNTALNAGIFANGGAAAGAGAGGQGGNVSLTANQFTMIASSDINSNGGNNTSTGSGGQAGTISITSSTAFATVANGDFIANGGTANSGVGGIGGTISVNAPSINVPTGQVMAAAGGSSTTGTGGAGGAITLTATSSTINLTTSSNVSILNAAGGGAPTPGSGGTINLNAPGTIAVNDTFGTTGNPATLDAGNTGTINANGVSQTNASHPGIDTTGSTSYSQNP